MTPDELRSGTTKPSESRPAHFHDDAGRRCRALASPPISRHGGRHIVRGAQPQVPEEDWPARQRVVVVEFASMEQLRAWFSSTDYAEALALGETALSRRLVFVEGVEDPKPGG